MSRSSHAPRHGLSAAAGEEFRIEITLGETEILQLEHARPRPDRKPQRDRLWRPDGPDSSRSGSAAIRPPAGQSGRRRSRQPVKPASRAVPPAAGGRAPRYRPESGRAAALPQQGVVPGSRNSCASAPLRSRDRGDIARRGGRENRRCRRTEVWVQACQGREQPGLGWITERRLRRVEPAGQRRDFCAVV